MYTQRSSILSSVFAQFLGSRFVDLLSLTIPIQLLHTSSISWSVVISIQILGLIINLFQRILESLYGDVLSYPTDDRKYDLPFLMSLNPVLRNVPSVRLHYDVLCLIHDLGIHRHRPRRKKTHRGKRAGARKRCPNPALILPSSSVMSVVCGRESHTQQIPVRITKRLQEQSKSPCFSQRQVSLTNIPLKGDHNFKRLGTKIGLWNARSMMNNKLRSVTSSYPRNLTS